MSVFALFVYNKYGDCVYHADYARAASSLGEGETSLVAGLVYTLQLFSTQLSATGAGGLRCMRTPHYKLHYYETITKYRLVLMSDTSLDGTIAQDVLRDVFDRVFVEWVVRDPAYRHAEGCLVTTPMMGTKLREYLTERRLLPSST